MLHTAKIIAASALVVIGVAVFAATLVHAVWYAPEGSGYVLEGNHTVPAKPVAHVPKGAPVRLLIPTLNIDANVQMTGVSAKGNMGVPTNFTDVAWFDGGTMPGQIGSAVIDGHVDNGLGLDGVFKHLGDIKVGDDIYVRTKEGAELHFVVHDIENYPYQSVPTEQIFHSQDGLQHLNLITCEGAWVKGDKTYDHRLVVYSTLTDS